MKRIILLVIGLILVSCTPGQNTTNNGDGGIVTPPTCSTPCVFGITPGITDTIEGTNVIKTPMSTAIHIDDVIGDGGLISLKPCGPPCFYGITPGVTSYDEAIKLIATQKNIFRNCKSYDNRGIGGFYGEICDHGIDFGSKDNIVEGINYSLLEKITIQQVIDSYGPPDFVTVYVVSLPEGPIISEMILFYDNLQAVVGLDQQDGREFMITASTKITMIAYITKELLNNKRTLQESAGGLVQWKGYGVYTAKLP